MSQEIFSLIGDIPNPRTKEFNDSFREAVHSASLREQACTVCGSRFIPIMNGGTFSMDEGMVCERCKK